MVVDWYSDSWRGLLLLLLASTLLIILLVLAGSNRVIERFAWYPIAIIAIVIVLPGDTTRYNLF